MGLENTLEIGGVCCVEQTAGNTLEYGKKEIPPLSVQHFMLFKGHYKCK